MDAVVATGNIGVGIGVAATQAGLLVGVSATNLLLDCIIYTKNIGLEAFSKGLSLEQALEERIYNAIEATQELVKNPSAKLNKQANAILDTANALSEIILGVEKAAEDPEWGLKERISFLASRIAGKIQMEASDRIIDPMCQQVNNIFQQLSKCLVLVDYLKQRREWTFTKMSQLSASMVEFRNEIEVEAKRVKSSPGDVLLGIIRLCSAKLNEQLAKLRSSELLSAPMQKQVQLATAYAQQMEDTFAKAKSIEQVNQEVIEEAKLKLLNIALWPSSAVSKAAAVEKKKEIGGQQ